jgi:hypothetical protein
VTDAGRSTLAGGNKLALAPEVGRGLELLEVAIPLRPVARPAREDQVVEIVSAAASLRQDMVDRRRLHQVIEILTAEEATVATVTCSDLPPPFLRLSIRNGHLRMMTVPCDNQQRGRNGVLRRNAGYHLAPVCSSVGVVETGGSWSPTFESEPQLEDIVLTHADAPSGSMGGKLASIDQPIQRPWSDIEVPGGLNGGHPWTPSEIGDTRPYHPCLRSPHSVERCKLRRLGSLEAGQVTAPHNVMERLEIMRHIGLRIVPVEGRDPIQPTTYRLVSMITNGHPSARAGTPAA